VVDAGRRRRLVLLRLLLGMAVARGGVGRRWPGDALAAVVGSVDVKWGVWSTTTVEELAFSQSGMVGTSTDGPVVCGKGVSEPAGYFQRLPTASENLGARCSGRKERRLPPAMPPPDLQVCGEGKESVGVVKACSVCRDRGGHLWCPLTGTLLLLKGSLADDDDDALARPIRLLLIRPTTTRAAHVLHTRPTTRLDKRTF
jgi:hypothetical protein